MYRIAMARCYHETNTFALERNESVEHLQLQIGHQLLESQGQHSCIGGFVERVRSMGAEVVPTLGIGFLRGGILSAALYESCRSRILRALEEVAPFDGIYFDLHGAMVAEDPHTDAEGDLLMAVRDAFGAIPIVATYDFHAIMSDREIALAVPFPYNTNPHIDGYERGMEAGECLIRMLAGDIQPVTRFVRVPILGPNIGQSTWAHDPEEQERLLLYQLNLERASLEETPGVLNVSILGGYGYADSPDAGMGIVATTDGDEELAVRMAQRLASELWRRRYELESVRPIHPIDEGVRMAMASDKTPVLLVDLGDDPGSACPADSPAVLDALLRLGARDAALTIRDPDVVRAGVEAGVGAMLLLPVGAKIDSRFYRPCQVTGIVKSIDDGRYMVCGPTHGGWGQQVRRETFREVDVGTRVVLRTGERIDIVCSLHSTGKDRDFFKSAGIILESKQILVLKSNQAHRASFDPVVARTIELNTPGVSTVNYARLPYRKLARPIWPLDRDMRWDGCPSE